jgi:hypothetical protein
MVKLRKTGGSPFPYDLQAFLTDTAGHKLPVSWTGNVSH